MSDAKVIPIRVVRSREEEARRDAIVAAAADLVRAARAHLAALALAAGRPDLVTDPQRLAALIAGLRSHYDADRRLTAPTLETPRV